MDIKTNGFLSIDQMASQVINRTSDNHDSHPVTSFRNILLNRAAEQTDALKFSKHASGRLQERNIDLSEEQLKRLNDGVKKSGEKGIKDSLVIVDEYAFIVNVPSNTVITAVDSNESNAKLFTNITGAVII